MRFLETECGYLLNLDHVTILRVKEGDSDTGCAALLARMPDGDEYDIVCIGYPSGIEYKAGQHEHAIKLCKQEMIRIANGTSGRIIRAFH
jgi:hypothetical protein